MTISWVNNVPDPTGVQGDDNQVLCVSSPDGTSSVNIGSLPYPDEDGMVFSIWMKAATETTVAINALGATGTVTVTTDWSRFRVVIATPAGTAISLIPAAGSGNVYMAMAQLEMGETPSDWRDAQQDYTSKTEFNIVNGKVETVVETVDSVVRETAIPGQYQVYVGGTNGNSFVSEDSNGVTVMEITKDSFTVNTGTVEFNVPNESLRIDDNGASMDNLTVNQNLVAPNIAQMYTGKPLVYISSVASSTDTYDVYPTLQDFLDAINYRVVQNQNIVVYVNETQYGEHMLMGVIGARGITITGSQTTHTAINGRLSVLSCVIPVSIQYLDFTYDPSTLVAEDNHAITVMACQYVAIEHCKITTSSTDRYCVSCKCGSVIGITDCELYAWQYGYLIYLGTGCKLFCENVSGGDTTALYLNANSSIIMWSGTRPNGDYIDDNKCIYVPSDLSTLTAAPTIIPPQPINPVIQYETTLTAWQTGSARSSDNWVSNLRWQNENYIRQGAGDTDRYIGVAWFDPSTLPSGTKIVKSVSLKLKRNADAGSSRAIPVTAYSNTVTKGTSNPHSGMTNQVALGTMLKGDETNFSASGGNLLAIAQAVVDGTANAIVFYADDTPTGKSGNYSTSWARFDGVGESVVPTLTIVYEVS